MTNIFERAAEVFKRGEPKTDFQYAVERTMELYGIDTVKAIETVVQEFDMNQRRDMELGR